MTVAELIDQLLNLNPDARVMVYNESCGSLTDIVVDDTFADMKVIIEPEEA
jgi:hypothetical protein